MGVPTLEVGYTTPPPEGRPRSSGEHAVAMKKKKTIMETGSDYSPAEH
jgi:hypothetical protein